MSSRKPEKAQSKSGRKKLILSKETLKDLTARDARVKGGRPNTRTLSDPCSF